jgi:CDP-6-deoxy-D-xylo-4-hexulose-3-dehydrase
MNKPINLVQDTIDQQDISSLISWLNTNPRLTKATRTVEFEQEWSNWLGCKYSVFVNSGSSANLAIFYALIVSNRLKNKKVVFPCLSWVTTVAPAIQLGLEPILCGTDRANLGIDVEEFEEICKRENPAALMVVHALGFPNDMKRIQEICEKYGVILLEDSCESVGTTVDGKKTGTLSLAASFSTYYGHHFSTIEGGLISTDDYELYNILKSIRSHGWSRDLDEVSRINLQLKYGIDDFRNFYTFYYPGFNLRSTDLQAYIGIQQLKKLDRFCDKRWNNLKLYDKYIVNPHWKISVDQFEYVSNFAYPIIHPRVPEIVKKLAKNSVECRPLIAGSISRQPFFYERYGSKKHPFADEIHDYGMYVPNNPDMTEDQIKFVSDIVNTFTVSKD